MHAINLMHVISQQKLHSRSTYYIFTFTSNLWRKKILIQGPRTWFFLEISAWQSNTEDNEKRLRAQEKASSFLFCFYKGQE